jgi:Putative peptidoglycan binding domain
VPERRTNSRRARISAARAGAAVTAIGSWLWTKAARRPVDSMAILCAAAASVIIVVNAAFLQSSAHPARFFVNPNALVQPVENRPTASASALAQRPTEAAPVRQIVISSRMPQTAAPRRSDPIADLIGSSTGSSAGPSTRVAAVQRALAEFGYGQIKPSGIFDEPTSAAIAKFERDHKLPVTGRFSDRFLSELASMTGRPIE